jgi:medium-chain acyl-[acyl-carrier-protein] hydrolase
MAALVERLVAELAPSTRGPFVVFGHSVGAKIGFEIARSLAAIGFAPRHLFVAASPSDTFPARGKGLHRLSREGLVRELRAMGTPERVLASDRLLDMLLPSIRADFQLATEYQVLPGPKLQCPLTAFAATRDPDVAVEDVAGWERHTTGPFRLERVDAGHHLLKERPVDLVRRIILGIEGARHVIPEER